MPSVSPDSEADPARKRPRRAIAGRSPRRPPTKPKSDDNTAKNPPAYEVNDTITLASSEQPFFKISIHNGPEISILFSSSLFEFIELLSMHIDFGKHDATLWYKYPTDREWEPLGYNDEWQGLLRTVARRPGTIQIRRSEELDAETNFNY